MYLKPGLSRKDLSKIAARKHLGMTIMRDCKGVPFAIPFIFHQIAKLMLIPFIKNNV